MWLQKRINKRIIKKTIWSKYVYQIEMEEKNQWGYEFNIEKTSTIKSFLQEGVNEMKKKIKKKSE